MHLQAAAATVRLQGKAAGWMALQLLLLLLRCMVLMMLMCGCIMCCCMNLMEWAAAGAAEVRLVRGSSWRHWRLQALSTRQRSASMGGGTRIQAMHSCTVRAAVPAYPALPSAVPLSGALVATQAAPTGPLCAAAASMTVASRQACLGGPSPDARACLYLPWVPM